jgi:predicted permease
MTPEQLLSLTIGITIAVLIASVVIWFILRRVLDKKHDEDEPSS